MSENAPVQLCQEEFAQREPLTTRLRGLVRSYPKGVGLSPGKALVKSRLPHMPARCWSARTMSWQGMGHGLDTRPKLVHVLVHNRIDFGIKRW